MCWEIPYDLSINHKLFKHCQKLSKNRKSIVKPFLPFHTLLNDVAQITQLTMCCNNLFCSESKQQQGFSTIHKKDTS